MNKWLLTTMVVGLAGVAAWRGFHQTKLAPPVPDACPQAQLLPPQPREARIMDADAMNEPIRTDPVTEAAVPSNPPPLQEEAPVAQVRTAQAETADLLVSDQLNPEQKQRIWSRIQEGGELDAVIAELKQRTALDPGVAGYRLTLGHALLQKLSEVEDPNERGILALQADQNLDAALSLDPGNWEAQFVKAAALARWPEGLNRGEEVIQRLTALIDQQETLPLRPEFAHSYVLLGDQYQKSGLADYAHAVWQMGSQWFPADADLRQRLAGAKGP